MKNAKLYLGGLKNLRGPKQLEAEDGRQQQNRDAKQNFKAGPVARTDRNAGRVTPLIPTHQVPVKPQKKGSTDGQ